MFQKNIRGLPYFLFNYYCLKQLLYHCYSTVEALQCDLNILHKYSKYAELELFAQKWIDDFNNV